MGDVRVAGISTTTRSLMLFNRDFARFYRPFAIVVFAEALIRADAVIENKPNRSVGVHSEGKMLRLPRAQNLWVEKAAYIRPSTQSAPTMWCSLLDVYRSWSRFRVLGVDV
jgi:hypothetical protein